MPFITKKGKPVWITPQRDKKFSFKKDDYDDTIDGVQIPDYILYGKDDEKFPYSTLEESKRAEKEFRINQKRVLQAEIMRIELHRIQEAENIYVKTYLNHAKKIQDLKSELSLNKEHEFYGGGNVWRRNREKKIEKEEKSKKWADEKSDELRQKRELYY
jgi:hypothetical protein